METQKGKKLILGGANLQDADFQYADLRGAIFRDANLQGADLREANLLSTDLQRANLQNADLREADLRNANFSFANLQGSDIHGALISNTALCSVCPEKGSFIAFKKCDENIIVTLLIPEDAKRSSATSRKCRASKAKVLEIDGERTEARSKYYGDFVYRLGETVEVSDFDEDRWNECSTGIHFFMTRREAEEY